MAHGGRTTPPRVDGPPGPARTGRHLQGARDRSERTACFLVGRFRRVLPHPRLGYGRRGCADCRCRDSRTAPAGCSPASPRGRGHGKTVKRARGRPQKHAPCQRIERHFPVNGRPVVVIQNVANGRIEVKSSKNPEVVVIANETSNKVGFEMEQAGDRVDVTASILDASAQPLDLETSLQLTVPEETELQLKTENGLIYVEQVMGDMTLESVAGDVHLKEVSGYIIVKTTGGSLVCTQCAGKLDFNSVGGGAQILQPALTNVNLRTTTGNILFDGDFIRTGLYSMKSGKGLVEVRFSGNDSFDLKAQTATGT